MLGVSDLGFQGALILIVPHGPAGDRSSKVRCHHFNIWPRERWRVIYRLGRRVTHFTSAPGPCFKRSRIAPPNSRRSRRDLSKEAVTTRNSVRVERRASTWALRKQWLTDSRRGKKPTVTGVWWLRTRVVGETTGWQEGAGSWPTRRWLVLRKRISMSGNFCWPSYLK